MAEPVALAALALDAALGWPRPLYRRIGHPVGAFARIIARGEAAWNRHEFGFARRRALGAALMLLLVLGAAGTTWTAQATIGAALGWPATALLAWPALAQRSLYDHVSAVAEALEGQDIAAARRAVGAIVGRDTAALDESGVARAAIESLAESFSDGVAAPLAWLLLLGLPGAWTYKAINTADSLIGHREARWRAFGWAAARLDDLANLVPARLSALLLCLAGGGGWRILWRDATKHASPNAGWPEAAMAGALGLRLAGPVAYDGAMHDKEWIGDGRPDASAADIRRALRVYVRACALLWLIAGGAGMGALMLQGTGSDVGKSVLVAGLCRAFANRGLRVRPFKPQNMSNNAAVTTDGGEIGRAQALQALACRAEPHSDMNPVLLKPQADRSSQLIVHGRVRGTLGSGNFREARGSLLAEVLQSYDRLRGDADLVIVEGAGSPAEINLRAGDIANMGFARAAGVPVVLVADIDRGGVIASLVGTRAVIDPADAAMIRGFLINKFRGDPALFADGYRAIEARTGWRGFGIVPWLTAAKHLPSEDAVVLEQHREAPANGIVVACPILPRIANFDDLDPLKLEPAVRLEMVPPGRPIPAEAALVVLPGSKATIADLAALRAEGWDIDLLAHHRRGGAVLGLCGGYQMLGRRVADPEGIEGAATAAEGLGLLDIETRIAPAKTLRRVAGTALGAEISGYEMHMGATSGAALARPFARIDGRPEGAMSADGRVMGSYVHGLLASPALRRALLARFGQPASGADYHAAVDVALDDIAAELERHVALDALWEIATS